MITTFALACLLSGVSTDLPTVTVTRDNTRIDQSCRIAIPKGTVIRDHGLDGVIHIEAPDIVVEFTPGTELRGAPPATPPNQYRGCGIRLWGHQGVTLRGLRISGFHAGVWAARADGLVIEHVNASDNYRERLLSDRLTESSADWLYPHRNDWNEWLVHYGAALYVENSRHLTVRHCKVWHGQNALCLDRVTAAKIYDNDFSFNSGWGVALWRSNHNVITRNALDFNVRGYSHGVYNRGQDSAALLAFEQNSHNVIAENSMTHSGDGFFGFAGREALGSHTPLEAEFDYTRRGNNDNLLVRNDLSYAPAHGYEMTFSFGNRLIDNRIVGNCICGMWGGYSQDTLVAHNTFADNGDMGYGLERGGINIEFGKGNRIVYNTFRDNRCGIHLWWKSRWGRSMEGPWAAANLGKSERNLIGWNTFTGDELGLHLRGAEQVTLVANDFEDVETKIDAEQDVTVIYPDNIAAHPVTVPEYPVYGTTRPVGARPQLRGRENIIMTEWGPWDHASPLVRLVENHGHTHVYALREMPASPDVQLDGDGVAGELIASHDAEHAYRYQVRGTSPGVHAYTLHVAAGQFRAQRNTAVTVTDWSLKFFEWDAHPLQQRAAWRKAAFQADGVTIHLQHLEFFHGKLGARRSASPHHKPAEIANERYGVLATTRVRLPAGKWRFVAAADDGVHVTVAGQTVIDAWRAQWTAKRFAGTYDMKQSGEVDIVVEHCQLEGWATLGLEIEPG